MQPYEMHLAGMHLIGVHLVGAHVTGVHLMSVPLIGVRSSLVRQAISRFPPHLTVHALMSRLVRRQLHTESYLKNQLPRVKNRKLNPGSEYVETSGSRKFRGHKKCRGKN